MWHVLHVWFHASIQGKLVKTYSEMIIFTQKLHATYTYFSDNCNIHQYYKVKWLITIVHLQRINKTQIYTLATLIVKQGSTLTNVFAASQNLTAQSLHSHNFFVQEYCTYCCHLLSDFPSNFTNFGNNTYHH